MIQFITHWNNNRDWEFALPAFANGLKDPFAIILHEFPPFSSEPPASLARRLSRAVVRRWEYDGRERSEWFKTRFLPRAGHIFVHSEALRDQLFDAGVAKERVTFAIHPIAELPLLESDVANGVRARFPNRRFVVIFGFPHPRKSLDRAIRALSGLPADVMLLFVGGLDGEFRQRYVKSLTELAEELHVSDRVHFLGEVLEPSLRGVFNLAEFALAPFSYATGSGSFAYLMSAGVPIAASDLPEHRMLQREGAGIALFEEGNQEQLVSSVNRLLKDGAERASLSQTSRAFVDRHSFASFANTVRRRIETLAR